VPIKPAPTATAIADTAASASQRKALPALIRHGRSSRTWRLFVRRMLPFDTGHP